MTVKLLPWPDDAVMIVASTPGKENRSNMEGFVDAKCRHCGADLIADTFTVRRAIEIAVQKTRHKRVAFFCIECHAIYDRDMCNILEDHRQRGK